MYRGWWGMGKARESQLAREMKRRSACRETVGGQACDLRCWRSGAISTARGCAPGLHIDLGQLNTPCHGEGSLAVETQQHMVG